MPLPSRTLAGSAALVATIALALPLVGCPEEAPACVDYTAPASFDGKTPTVSFARDVLPIFAQSCAFTSCHGSTSGSANGVALGGNEAAKVHRAIVDVRSSKLPAMSYVKAGSDRESFLMRKVDGSHCALVAQCTAGDCGQSMPRNDETLPLEARDTIRRWILQGAKNE